MGTCVVAGFSCDAGERTSSGSLGVCAVEGAIAFVMGVRVTARD
jgi:hypothetical protein